MSDYEHIIGVVCMVAGVFGVLVVCAHQLGKDFSKRFGIKHEE